jgi:hypothetical protein
MMEIGVQNHVNMKYKKKIENNQVFSINIMNSSTKIRHPSNIDCSESLWMSILTL